ncbi:MAG TPA: 1-acyl-sn-glycerol-3-phosphate acyltransferase [Longimicrobiaceae bacterium]|nr:1-acyl-sn-glycerol-3-phosphate acyltransferase [Longimicrobiaceae bacterium]
MRSLPVFLLLLLWKVLSRLFYRFDVEWVGEVPEDPWEDLRIISVLHHTSLYEPVFAAVLPNRVVWRIARDAVVPIASKTMERRGAGWMFRFVGRRVVPVSRKRDLSWEQVLRHCCGPRAITIIFPEGRMMRRTGLDVDGRPMTIKAGVADLIAGIDSGRMLIAYSGGLHHVAAPGERFPRLFKEISLRLEVLDIPAYREALGGTRDMDAFRGRVVEDLTRRRNRYAPLRGPTLPQWAA